ncbi:nucleoside deaminase [Melissococcus plutonius]|uniref:Cytosine deaminase n=1 Tax=Melissococcus plutonius TaxID=33970 RepID=A0A2Z5Y0W2_9ENTE|nr:nucleoside deaminase [Melissococcus plutonius]BAL61561.1 cytosine deaminase [Melissococcus plutonius DAT561]MCV2498492.1 nucleoside deaminase [Melissococcus plutonius]MCV2501252.1 nucleoside deaminase [Melissococcus plutonius]MCV2505506.1 nucleoside deaminase [Melissococcus plutonius]MCV2507107.1 nucleoside deaminase [Melissococcus plutonius]
MEVSKIKKDHLYYLKRCIEISKQAKKNGNTPFGALLVDDAGNILFEQENIEITEHICTGHAETTLAARASKKYSKDFLWGCTLYTTAEPCAMCTGTIYWGNIGTIVFGMTERRLLELTGNNPQNPTFDLPAEAILVHGQKDIKVIGPFSEIEEAIANVHEGYWK